ncbi:PRD domain protein [compost metagenome]
MAAMIDRLKKGDKVDEFEYKDNYIKDNKELYEIIKSACNHIENQYDINIYDDEICYIITMLNYKNYTKL